MVQLDPSLYDFGVISYGSHITSDGERFYYTKVSNFGSIILRLISVLYIVFTLISWIREFHIEIVAKTESRQTIHLLPSNVVETLEATIVGFNSSSIFVLSVGATFAHDLERGIITFQTNCTAYDDNFPSEIYPVRDMIVRGNTIVSDKCRWMENNMMRGRAEMFTLYFVKADCSERFRNFQVRFRSFSPSSNSDGLSEHPLGFNIRLLLGHVQTIEFVASTLNVHKYSQYRIFGLGHITDTTKYKIQSSDEWSTAIESWIDSFGLSSLLLSNACASEIRIILDPTIYEQDIYPDSILDCFTRIGGFMGFIAMIGIVFAIYNGHKLDQEVKHDVWSLERGISSHAKELKHMTVELQRILKLNETSDEEEISWANSLPPH